DDTAPQRWIILSNRALVDWLASQTAAVQLRSHPCAVPVDILDLGVETRSAHRRTPGAEPLVGRLHEPALAGHCGCDIHGITAAMALLDRGNDLLVRWQREVALSGPPLDAQSTEARLQRAMATFQCFCNVSRAELRHPHARKLAHEPSQLPNNGVVRVATHSRREAECLRIQPGRQNRRTNGSKSLACALS